jgi:hypothetical protein
MKQGLHQSASLVVVTQNHLFLAIFQSWYLKKMDTIIAINNMDPATINVFIFS